MKNLFRLIIASVMLTISSTLSAQEVFLGSWSGNITVGQTRLTIVLNLSQNQDGILECTLDSPDQGAKGIKAVAAVSNSISLEINVASLGATYKGIYFNNSLIGTFSQLGQEFPLTLKKGIEKLNRPQEPSAPFPYTEEEVTFVNEKAEAKLAGSLITPQAAAEGCPVVIFVTGSGQENRNEEIYDHKPFLVIADYLARNGIASLRFDDRNFGTSHGGDVANATTLDFLEDARAGVNFLKSKSCFGRIGVIGHSEGGSIAFMLGAANDVDFVISLAGIGVKGDEALAAQANRVFELQGSDQRYTIQSYRSAVHAQRNKWLDWFIDYDPSEDIKACTCPVFAVNGDKDCQVISALNLTGIQSNLSDNPANFIKEYPELNHLFQHCQTGLPTEYRQIEETVSTEVLADLCAWILETSRHQAH